MLLLSLFACQSEQEVEAPGQYLPLTIFDIQPNQDTLLVGPGGVRLHIPATSWKDAKGKLAEGTIHIHLKEALTLADMVIGGLGTTTDSELLESDGMFYWEAVDGEGNSIHPNDPIKVEVPVSKYLPGAKVFEGKVNEAGEMTWASEKEIPDISQKASIRMGEELFQTHCSPCHKIDKDMTGPALAGVAALFEWDWLSRFTKNTPQMINNGDTMAILLYEQWGTMMQGFPSFTDQEIEAIYQYIDFETLKFDQDSMNLVKNNKRQWLDSIWDNRGELFIKDKAFFESIDSVDNLDWKEQQKESEANRFFYEISQAYNPGWYNIDRLYKQRSVLLAYEATTSLHDPDFVMIKLVIPQNRIVLLGKQQTQGNTYFNYSTKDKQSFLPINTSVLLVATAIKDNEVYFGITESTIQDGVTEKIEMKPLSRQEIGKRLESIF